MMPPSDNRLLIVDDDRDFAESLKLILKPQDYQVTLVHNGPDALHAVKEISFQVALLDVRLGVHNGIDLISQLRTVRPEIVCIVITAFASLDSSIQALHEGAHDYLQKPIHPKALFATLNRCFEIVRLKKEKNEAVSALKLSEEKYRRFFTAETDAVLILEAGTNRIVDLNVAAVQLYGYSYEEFLGLQLTDISAEPEKTRETIESIIARKTTKIPLRYHKKKGGTVFPVELTVGTFPLRGSQVHFAVIRDITRRRQVQEELGHYRERLEVLVKNRTEEIRNAHQVLKENQRFLSTLISNLPGMVYRCRNDRDRTMEYVSDGCQELTGYSIEALADNKTVSFGQDIIYSEDRAWLWEQVQTAVSQHRSFQLVYRIADALGKEKWVWEQGRGIYNSVGFLEALEGFIIDITERKRTEETLSESDERFRQVAETAGEWIWEVDSKGRYTYSSPGVEKILGFKVRNVVANKYFFDFFPADQRDKIKREAFRVFEKKEPFQNFQNTNKHKNGRLVILQTCGLPILDEGGQLLGYRGTHQDITERKLAEQALKDAHDKLERRVKDRTADLKAVNQQLQKDIAQRKCAEAELKESREELRALLDRIQTVREEERARIARDAHDVLGQDLIALQMDLALLEGMIPSQHTAAGEKIGEIKQCLLGTLDKLEKIATELRPEVLDVLGLPKAIEWQAREFKNRTAIEYELNIDPKDLEIETECATAIFRIFQESLANVTRHAGASKINVSMKIEKRQLIFTIRDNGKGISKKQLANRKSLGLLGIQERARMIGGQAEIKGIPRKGTSVILKIPLHSS